MTSFPTKGTFHSPLFHYHSISSTIDVAKEYIRSQEKNVRFGTTFVANCQTDGKGQRNNKWLSVSNAGLYFTCVYNTSQYHAYGIHLQHPAQVSLCMANAIARTLQSYQDRHSSLCVQIKWPNDVLIHEKKVAGILSEVYRDWQILSAGINLITQKWEQHADTKEAPITPTALQEHGKTVAPMEFYALLLPLLERELLRVPKDIVNYSNTLLWKKDEQICFEDVNGTIVGEVLGIREDGVLMLRVEDTRIVTKSSGRIRALPHICAENGND